MMLILLAIFMCNLRHVVVRCTLAGCVLFQLLHVTIFELAGTGARPHPAGNLCFNIYKYIICNIASVVQTFPFTLPIRSLDPQQLDIVLVERWLPMP